MAHKFFVLDQLSIGVDKALAIAAADGFQTPGPYRPSEWSTRPALTSITVPAQLSAVNSGISYSYEGNPLPNSQAPTGATVASTGSATILVFDAVLHAAHARQLTRTRHPIQTSASSPVSSVSDHAYLEAPTVTLEIGMSDAMASFSSEMWTGAKSKSISAYQTLVALCESRTLITLTTRLETYENMLVESIHTPDDVKTLHGLRASVVFSHISLASATAVASALNNSTRPALTNSTPVGNVQPIPLSSALAMQHKVTSGALATFPTVPNAGNWSSANVGKLGSLFNG